MPQPHDAMMQDGLRAAAMRGDEHGGSRRPPLLQGARLPVGSAVRLAARPPGRRASRRA